MLGICAWGVFPRGFSRSLGALVLLSSVVASRQNQTAFQGWDGFWGGWGVDLEAVKNRCRSEASALRRSVV